MVEGFGAPIFIRKEMGELLRIAAEIEGEPPARAGSTYLLSGLVYCQCGAKLYPVKTYVATRQERRPLVYDRCRRASHNGTCDMRPVPVGMIEPLLVRERWALTLPDSRNWPGPPRRTSRPRCPLFERRAASAQELAEECASTAAEITAERAGPSAISITSLTTIAGADSPHANRSSRSHTHSRCQSSHRHTGRSDRWRVQSLRRMCLRSWAVRRLRRGLRRSSHRRNPGCPAPSVRLAPSSTWPVPPSMIVLARA